jgi:hypothetical protein
MYDKDLKLEHHDTLEALDIGYGGCWTCWLRPTRNRSEEFTECDWPELPAGTAYTAFDWSGLT